MLQYSWVGRMSGLLATTLLAGCVNHMEAKSVGATAGKSSLIKGALSQSQVAGVGQGSVTDGSGNTWSVSASGDVLENGNAVPGGSGTAKVAYVASSNSIWGQDASTGNWYSWDGSSWNGPSANLPDDPQPPQPPPPNGGGNFTVSPSAGFVDPSGLSWTMRGLNAGVQDALQGYPNVLSQYPGLSAIRLNCDPGNDSSDSIDQVVEEYTARGVMVMIEDHSGFGDNVGWYTQMASKYKTNSLVFLETPNEPNTDSGTTSQFQIEIIQAIRNAGFGNPIGIQPVGGYDQSNLDAVISAVGVNQLFVTPHIYYAGNDPQEAGRYAQNEIDGATQRNMFSAIDEFGDALDGYNRDPQGQSVIDAIIAVNQAGKTGAIFWAMDNGNHPDGTDSAFLTPDGSQLTSVGQGLQPWLR